MMPRLAATLLGLAALAAPGLAAAQSSNDAADADRFFVDKVDDADSEDSTLLQGSLTGSSFFHAESADPAAPDGGLVGVENAAPFTRWFSELRAQLDARHIAGGAYDARVDTRVRYVPQLDSLYDTRRQAGLFGDNEYDIRELWIARSGKRADIFVGRQSVLDLAATKIDGLRVDYAKSSRWTYIGFGGLYPTRGSRSIADDYPRQVSFMANQPVEGGRTLPVAGGLGAAYRSRSAYGSVGVVGIVPLAEDIATGEAETPRTFMTTTGYWQATGKVDLYHYLIFDATGADGARVTNLSLGVNWKPQPRLRVTGSIHRVDTETLNVQAQTRLENDGDDGVTAPANLVQNNVAVARLASDAARAGLSVALGAESRFELSTDVAVRQRPDIVLGGGGNDNEVTLAAARSAEVGVQAVDRHSLAGLRLQGNLSYFFGLGSENLLRSKSIYSRLAATRELAGGDADVELNVTFLSSADDNRGLGCGLEDLTTCYGAATSTTVAVGGSVFYRFADDWFVMTTLELGRQSLTTTTVALGETAQPAILRTTGFVRLAYRF